MRCPLGLMGCGNLVGFSFLFPLCFHSIFLMKISFPFYVCNLVRILGGQDEDNVLLENCNTRIW